MEDETAKEKGGVKRKIQERVLPMFSEIPYNKWMLLFQNVMDIILEEEGDLEIIISFSPSNQQIHRALQLQDSPIPPGTTEDDSRLQFMAYVKQRVMSLTNVIPVEAPTHYIFSNVSQLAYLATISKLSQGWSRWESRCTLAGVSVGTLQVTVAGDGGCSKMILSFNSWHMLNKK